jgi:large subunit ribosomal protein L4
MIELPVHDREGKVVENVQFDESCLGQSLNIELMHKAIVAYEAHQRQGTVNTRNVRMMTGSNRKPYRQKGTGRARMGNRRRVGSVGGGICHGPHPRAFNPVMNRKSRRAALKSALLSKFLDGEVLVVNELNQKAPKTRDVASALKNLKIDKTCLIVTDNSSDNLWKSVRNIAGTEMAELRNLNTYNVLRPHRLLLTKAALEALSREMK